MQLPIEPMAPITRELIPSGDDWGYQIKWDGVRLITQVTNEAVTLYSRNGLVKNAVYPELASYLDEAIGCCCVLDGEAVVFDPVKGRPNFQLVLQRERMKNPLRITGAASLLRITYVLFDLLEWEGEDMRQLPYEQRHHLLKEQFPMKQEAMFVSDLFSNGAALWQWVEQQGWEGMVSKRLSSTYSPGKKHKDWFKKKTIQHYEVMIVGLTLNEGQLASLVMSVSGVYFGRVSLGLNEARKRRLLQLPVTASNPFNALPTDLRGVHVLWLVQAFTAVVSGLEVTDYGLLRHPKIVDLRFHAEGEEARPMDREET